MLSLLKESFDPTYPALFIHFFDQTVKSELKFIYLEFHFVPLDSYSLMSVSKKLISAFICFIISFPIKP